MTPEQVAASYDQIADRWLDVSTYGFAQIERAVAFVKNKGVALDVVARAVEAMTSLGARPERIRAALRPEVSPEPANPPTAAHGPGYRYPPRSCRGGWL